MKVYKRKIEFESKHQIEFIDVTSMVQDVIDNSGVREGQATIFVPHTSMGVVVNHNEPMLIQDFMKFFFKIAPVDDKYSHDLFELRRGSKSDGRSNGHSHCKSMLLGISQTIPIEKGKMLLSDKQTIFAVEFDGSRKRELIVQVIGL